MSFWLWFRARNSGVLNSDRRNFLKTVHYKLGSCIAAGLKSPFFGLLIKLYFLKKKKGKIRHFDNKCGAKFVILITKIRYYDKKVAILTTKKFFILITSRKSPIWSKIIRNFDNFKKIRHFYNDPYRIKVTMKLS